MQRNAPGNCQAERRRASQSGEQGPNDLTESGLLDDSCLETGLRQRLSTLILDEQHPNGENESERS